MLMHRGGAAQLSAAPLTATRFRRAPLRQREDMQELSRHLLSLRSLANVLRQISNRVYIARGLSRVQLLKTGRIHACSLGRTSHWP